MPEFDDTADVRTVNFDLLRTEIKRRFHLENLTGIDIRETLCHETGDMVLRITRLLPTILLERFRYQWPRDWWEAFKARWFPVFARLVRDFEEPCLLLQRWPVRYTVVEKEARAVFHDLPVPPRRPFHFQVSFWDREEID